MIYGLLGVQWVVAVGSVIDEVWALDGLDRQKHIVKMIPLTVFWILSKEQNCRAFKGIENDLYRLRDK